MADNLSTRVKAPDDLEHISSQSQPVETHDRVASNPIGRVALDGDNLCSPRVQSGSVVLGTQDPEYKAVVLSWVPKTQHLYTHPRVCLIFLTQMF